MKHIIPLALAGLILLPAAQAAPAANVKSAVKINKPSAGIDANGVKINKPSVELDKSALPTAKKPEAPSVKKPEVEVTKPAATLDANGVKLTKPDVKLK